MAEERVVDVRGLEPPEPMERVLAALATLAPDQHLRMVHHREPRLLYPILDKRGYAHSTRQAADDCYEIRIWRREPAPG